MSLISQREGASGENTLLYYKFIIDSNNSKTCEVWNLRVDADFFIVAADRLGRIDVTTVQFFNLVSTQTLRLIRENRGC